MADPKLTKLLAKIHKDTGGKVNIRRLQKVRTAYHLRRPFGIMGLDIALAGGLPGGSIVQIHGRDGMGKNAIANMCVAENQRIYEDESRAFLVSFGYKPDLSHMRLCDVTIALTDQELEELGYADPNKAPADVRGETIGELVTIELAPDDGADDAPSEAFFSAATLLVQSGLFQLGIVDEMGSGETKDSVIKELDENVKVATWSSLVTRWCQRMYTVLRKPLANGEPNATTIVVLNPARAGGVGGGGGGSKKYTPADVQTSGHALKHAKAIDIHLRNMGVIREKNVKVGKEVGWRIMKGKHGISEGAEGSFKWMFEYGVDMFDDLIKTAKAYDTVWRKGNKWYILDRDDKEDGIGGGIEGVVDYLREHPDLFDPIREATLYEATKGDDDDDNEVEGN